MTKWVYNFGNGAAEGDAALRELLGGKGANLAEMSLIGLPVPPGFTLSTEICTYFYDHKMHYPDGLEADVDKAIATIEAQTGMGFGKIDAPLLVSVRSGARASMPGMMDTVLNLGLNQETVEGLAKSSGDPRFAYDSYRRFIQMYANVVLNVDHHLFESQLEDLKLSSGVNLDTELTPAQLQSLVKIYLQIVEEETATPFPQDPKQQLWGAIGAVFKSWMTPRAKVYRSLHNIPESWGTAVNIQAMVFGNMGDDCATGVAFTRDPSTGKNVFYGEYLINAQGEDVVAGIRTPQHLTIAGRKAQGSDLPSMEEAMPEIFKQLEKVRMTLEQHYKDMQDIEFTVQSGILYMLQTRNGKRASQAAIKIACDMVDEGLIDRQTAIMRVEPQSLDQILHPRLDPKAPRNLLAKGLPASPGAASGMVCFQADEAEKLAAAGHKILLTRIETSPEDIHGMHAAQGILTARGGMTSHAAVVARGMGRPCVSGAGSLQINYQASQVEVNGQIIKAGDWLTIDGASGEIFVGKIPTVQPELSGDFARIMGWADEIRILEVRTNAETPDDVATALKFGAQGIGLCRTEHMFFDANRILAVREMILADAENEQARIKALAKLLPFQKQDFVDIFKIMRGLPVTIRLLDPPLHEFLPHGEAEYAELAEITGKTVDAVKRRVQALQEVNPMLGHRGCRLLISYPEICEMQARAIFEAAIEVNAAASSIEIMIPLVGMGKELSMLKGIITKIADQIKAEKGTIPDYKVGTMIELPRAALLADEIAKDAEFFSFGTNDLTQTTFGLSRDDSSNFLNSYQRKGIMEHDPFQTLDQEGVGALIKIAVERGRSTRNNIKLGICGEHGGDPASIEFCAQVGIDYVSCSPFRVPIARLSAAQSAIRNQKATS
ncbi:MAG: pyruvate, phosphate dikinase [Alphaproteobacteria bacterium]